MLHNRCCSHYLKPSISGGKSSWTITNLICLSISPLWTRLSCWGKRTCRISRLVTDAIRSHARCSIFTVSRLYVNCMSNFFPLTYGILLKTQTHKQFKHGYSFDINSRSRLKYLVTLRYVLGSSWYWQNEAKMKWNLNLCIKSLNKQFNYLLSHIKSKFHIQQLNFMYNPFITTLTYAMLVSIDSVAA